MGKIQRIRQNMRFRLARVYLLIASGVNTKTELMQIIPLFCHTVLFDDLKWLHLHGYIRVLDKEEMTDEQKTKRGLKWVAIGAVRPEDVPDCPCAA